MRNRAIIRPSLINHEGKKDLIHTCRVVQDESSCLTKVGCGGNWKILVSTWVLAVEGGDKGPGEPENSEDFEDIENFFVK